MATIARSNAAGRRRIASGTRHLRISWKIPFCSGCMYLSGARAQLDGLYFASARSVADICFLHADKSRTSVRYARPEPSARRPSMQFLDQSFRSLIQINKVVLRRMHMRLAGKCSDNRSRTERNVCVNADDLTPVYTARMPPARRRSRRRYAAMNGAARLFAKVHAAASQEPTDSSKLSPMRGVRYWCRTSR